MHGGRRFVVGQRARARARVSAQLFSQNDNGRHNATGCRLNERRGHHFGGFHGERCGKRESKANRKGKISSLFKSHPRGRANRFVRSDRPAASLIVRKKKKSDALNQLSAQINATDVARGYFPPRVIAFKLPMFR